MGNYLKIFFIAVLVLVTSIGKGFASTSLSYSGRLVNNNGSPVSGGVNLKFDLAYSDQLNVILCSQELNGVELSQGVFHVKLTFPLCNLTEVLAGTPAGNAVSIRVTDKTSAEKVYSFQAIQAVPVSLISQTSKQLLQMDASEGQVLSWNGSEWAPETIDTTISNGSVTGDMLAGNIPRSKIAAGVANHILVNDGSGNLSSLDAPSTMAYLGAMAFADVPLCLSHQKLQMNPGPAFWSCVTDETLDVTKLPLSGGTLTGALVLSGDPSNPMEAATKSYVDTEISNINESQWTTLSSNHISFDGKISIAGGVRFMPNVSNTVELKAHIGTAEDLLIVLPPDKGTAGQALVTDGNGNLSWAAPVAADSSSIGGDLSGTVSNASINIGAVTSAKIADGTITNADIANLADIEQSKIKDLAFSLSNKEDKIVGGSSGDYWDGSRTWINFDERARNSISVDGPLTYNNVTGSLGFMAPGTAGNLLRSNGTTWESWVPNFLTSETDTLQTVTDRGANTTTFSKFSGGASFSHIGIGTDTPVGVLDIQSTTSGLLIPRMDAIQRDAIVSPGGMQIYNTSTNKINFHDGTNWQELGVAGAGVQSLTIGTGLTPTGTINSSGTIAVDVGVTAGKIIQVDASHKLPAIDGSQLINLSPASLSGIIPVNKGGTGLSTQGASNTLLGSNAAGTALEYKVLGASSPLSLSYSAGGIALGLNTVPVSLGGTGVTSLAGNGIITANALGTGLDSKLCADGEILKFNSAGTTECLDVESIISTTILQNGNSFGSGVVIGSNDNQPLSFETNDSVKMSILSDGNVGIGVTGPTNKLEVSGDIALTGNLKLKSSNANFVELRAPAALTSTVNYILPASAGGSGEVLTTDGTGILSWTSVATTTTGVGGDLTGTIANAQIANGVVTYPKLNLTDGDIPQAKVNGLVTALSGKEPSITAGTSLQYWSGDKTWQTLNTTAVPEGTRLYFTQQRVLDSLLSGYGGVSASALPIGDGESVLTSLKKLQLQITANDTDFDNTGQWGKNGTSVYYTNSVGVGTSTPGSSAVLDVNSTTKGMLPPRMNAAQRDAITSPAAGLVIYNTTAKQLQIYDGSQWTSGSGTGSQEVSQAANVNMAQAAATDIISLNVASGGRYLILASGNSNVSNPWSYFSISCSLLKNGTVIDKKDFYYGMISGGSGAQFPLTHYSVQNLATSDILKINCLSTSDAGIRTTHGWKITLLNLGIHNQGSSAADNLGDHIATKSISLGGHWLSGDGDNEGLKVDNSGKVGIGTGTPQEKLDVNGNINMGARLTSYVDGANNAFWLAKGSSPELNRIGFGMNADPSTGIINSVEMRTNGVSRVTVDNSGRVGIGLVNPSEKLEIEDGNLQIRTNNAITSLGDPAGLRVFSKASANLDYLNIGWVSENIFGIQSADSGTYQTLALNPFGGKVGIGMSNPTLELQVVGRSQFQDGATNVGLNARLDSVLDVNNNTGTKRSFSIHHFSGSNTLAQWYNCAGSCAEKLNFDINGNMWIAGTLTQASDERLKDNIQPLENNLEKLSQLNGVTYQWKDKRHSENQIGLIAQEVEKVYPEAVRKNADGFLSVGYQNLVAPIIEALKELHQEWLSFDQKYQREIASLKEENEKLRKKNESFEKRLEALESAQKEGIKK